jgi:diacylglycerol kinase (ATP)
MAWTAIVNPTAGRGRTRRLLPDLPRALADLGVAAEVHVSRAPDEPAGLAKEAAARGHDLLAVGGDGLVSVVAAVAADEQRRLAVVPSGSGNDFARELGHDAKRPLDALRALVDGDDRRVDLGRVNGRWFTTVTATGFDAEANRWANTVTRLSGTPLYVAAVARTLVRYRPRRFAVAVDEREVELDAWLVATGNGPAYGGGMRVAPDARLDDGLLHVTVVGPVSRLGFVRTFPRVFRGTHTRHPLVQTFRGTRVRVASLDGEMDAYADGERVGPLPASIEAVPRALSVRAPR